MPRPFVTGIDIGTSSVRIVVAEHQNDKPTPVIIGAAQKESRGLRHGYIINFEDAVQSIKDAIKEAEKNAKVKISKGILGMGGISLGSSYAEGSVAVSRADSEVTDTDLKRALSASEANLKDIANRKILHTIPLAYKLDGKKVNGRILGMRGGILEVRTMFITCQEQHHEDLLSALEAAGVEIEETIASPLAESHLALTKVQKRAGCLLANIGAETVSLAIFEDGIPVSLHVLQIGSTDITNDIALGLKIPLEEAERIKKFRDDEGRDRRRVDDIIDARLSDIFELIEAHLKRIGKNGLLPAGIILSGGGAITKGIEDFARDHLELPARVATYRELRDPTWSIAYALCVLGLNPEAEENAGFKMARETGNLLLKWLKQFMP